MPDTLRAVLTAAALTLALSACGGEDPGPADKAGPPTTATPRPASSPPSAPPSAAATGSAGIPLEGVARCEGLNMLYEVVVDDGPAAARGEAGRGKLLALNNTEGPCLLDGFPTLTAEAGTVTLTSTPLGARAEPMVLKAGKEAVAVLRHRAAEAGASPSARPVCTEARTVRVTLAGARTTHPAKVVDSGNRPAALAFCGGSLATDHFRLFMG
ncbi:DUF4232 domain-containing protein [Streptomyces purpureus]|uniref:DUF4232 domain-containing protein n=1 Tax=Streptomyces purpureus TaxID=1951 RepID=UPI00379C9DB2